MTGGTLRALIVDDEPIARRRVRRLLAAAPDVTVIGECGDGDAAVQAIREGAPDLVFLDVQMPGCDGLEVVRAVGAAGPPAVIFVTAYDQYALQAFELHALDYLLKPFGRERFAQALDRARADLTRRGRQGVHPGLAALAAALASGPRHLARFVVRTGDRIRLVAATDVDWIQAADNYVTLHVGGAEHLLRDTMGAIERVLDAARFVRIHRSAIVQIDRIAELRPATHGDFTVVLRDGTRLTLSRTYRPRLERLLNRPL